MKSFFLWVLATMVSCCTVVIHGRPSDDIIDPKKVLMDALQMLPNQDQEEAMAFGAKVMAAIEKMKSADGLSVRAFEDQTTEFVSTIKKMPEEDKADAAKFSDILKKAIGGMSAEKSKLLRMYTDLIQRGITTNQVSINKAAVVESTEGDDDDDDVDDYVETQSEEATR